MKIDFYCVMDVIMGKALEFVKNIYTNVCLHSIDIIWIVLTLLCNGFLIENGFVNIVLLDFRTELVSPCVYDSFSTKNIVKLQLLILS